MDCCAHSQGPELGLERDDGKLARLLVNLLSDSPSAHHVARLLRSVALVAWRALTASYSDVGISAVFILTFMWVLVLKKGTPISSGQDAPDMTTRRAA